MINVSDQEKLLIDMGRKLKRQITVYAVGGTAMMFHGLKDITKDIDLVFTNKKDRDDFKRVAQEVGYKGMNTCLVYGTKPNQPIMLARGDEERFDLFIEDVIHFNFSEKMIERAISTHEFGENLMLKIADPHDIILLKCSTDRIKDRDDARKIIDNYKINWGTIISEITNQRRLGKTKAIFELASFVDDLIKIGVKIPENTLPKLNRMLLSQVDKSETQGKLSEY